MARTAIAIIFAIALCTPAWAQSLYFEDNWNQMLSDMAQILPFQDTQKPGPRTPAVAQSGNAAKAKAFQLLQASLACPIEAKHNHADTYYTYTYYIAEDQDKLMLYGNVTEYSTAPEDTTRRTGDASQEDTILNLFSARYADLGDVSISGNMLVVHCQNECESRRDCHKCATDSQSRIHCSIKSGGGLQCTKEDGNFSQVDTSFPVFICSAQINNARVAFDTLIKLENSEQGGK